MLKQFDPRQFSPRARAICATPPASHFSRHLMQRLSPILVIAVPKFVETVVGRSVGELPEDQLKLAFRDATALALSGVALMMASAVESCCAAVFQAVFTLLVASAVHCSPFSCVHFAAEFPHTSSHPGALFGVCSGTGTSLGANGSPTARRIVPNLSLVCWVTCASS